MDYGLADKVVVVSGAGSGIGRATTEAFLLSGALVVAGDIQPAALRGLSGSEHAAALHVVEVDLASAEGPSALVQSALALHGHVDVLINNVGVAPYRESFLDVSDEDWLGTLTLNVLAAVRASRAVLPGMVEQRRGAIVSIASDAGRQPDPFFVDYALSKAAILSLSKSLSIEFGPFGIRSNSVSPGPTLTPALEPFLSSLGRDLGMPRDEALEHFATVMRRLPLGRLNTAEDVASVVLFLASDQARQVTGADYSVNAGSTKFV